MIRHHFNKLIRNKLPARMEKEGLKLVRCHLGKEEYAAELKKKLIEEANEVAESDDKQHLTIELADVMEVIHEIARVHDISMESIEHERLLKREINGAFSADCYAEYVESEDDHQAFKDYLISKNKPYIRTN